MITKAKKKNVGEFKTRVTVQKETLESDGMGGQYPVWVTDFSIWARVRPIRGTQRLHLDAIQQTVTDVIETRWTGETLTDRRITFDGRILNVHYHLSPDEERAYTELGAAEELQ